MQIDELNDQGRRAKRASKRSICAPATSSRRTRTAATLLEKDQLYVRIYVPETLIGKHRALQQTEVPVTVDSFPGKSFQGVIEHITEQGEYSPRTLQPADERADPVFAARVGLRTGPRSAARRYGGVHQGAQVMSAKPPRTSRCASSTSRASSATSSRSTTCRSKCHAGWSTGFSARTARASRR